MDMTFELARRVVDAMRAAALERGSSSAYAVVDKGGNLVIFEVDDNVILAAREIAINKAWTALTIGESTLSLSTQVQPGQDFYGLTVGSPGQRVVAFAGGHPLAPHGQSPVGGCGASGGELDDDEFISLAGQRAYLAAISDQEAAECAG